MDVEELARELGVDLPVPPSLTVHALTRNAPVKDLPFNITLSPEQTIGKCMCGWMCVTDDVDSAYDSHLRPVDVGVE